jgi:phage repressor protein C with HTH and peptisase S24 domain
MDADHSHPADGAIAEWDSPGDLPAGGANHAVVHLYEIELAAGDGCQWIEHSDADPLLFRRRWLAANGLKVANLRGLYVRGSSMEPGLYDGDAVVIDISQTEIRDDAVYAVSYAGDLFIKRLFRLPGGGIELRSDNPRHPSREIHGADLEQLTILGRMVWRGGAGG